MLSQNYVFVLLPRKDNAVLLILLFLFPVLEAVFLQLVVLMESEMELTIPSSKITFDTLTS